MPMKLLSAEDFRSAAKDGGRPDGTVFRFAATEPQNVDGAARTKRFVFSDATVDHAGDTIDPKGWDLGIFKRNPVALFSHMSWEPPIGRASNVAVEGDQLVGDIEFAAAEVYEFADTIYRLVDGGYMKAVSVGFKPKEWAFTNDKNRPYGIDFKKQTLLEISVCPVPCNPNALSEARSIGIDTRSLVDWAEKVLDSGDTVFLPRKELEVLRGQASSAEATRYYIQSDKIFSASQIEHVRDAVKRWQDNPSEILVLDRGLTLRTIGAGDPAVGDGVYVIGEEAAEASADELLGLLPAEAITDDVRASFGKALAGILGKAGRRVSAATKAKLQEAMGHHDTLGKCIKDVMEDADPDEDPDEDEVEEGLQPPGAVVPESDDHLTPEERRMKEVRALRSALPVTD